MTPRLLPTRLPTLSFVLVAALVFTPEVARAQAASDETKAQAVQLFDEAEQHAAAGRFAEACPNYADSYRLDPQLGVLLYLAECYEKNGQLASAWGSFRAAIEIADQRRDARAEVARARVSALAPRLSRLAVKVPAAARVPGLVVTRDGAKLPESMFGSAVAVDSGTHRVTAEAPGYEPWSADFDVAGEGAETKAEVPTLKRSATPPPTATPAGSAVSTPAESSDGSGQRIAAIGLGGLGLVGIGIGGFFGLSAQSSYSDSKDLCSEKNICTADGTKLRNTAKSRALVATVATGVGAAALAAAGVLWFTAPFGSDRASAGAPPRIGVRLSSDGAGFEAVSSF
jgi:hypothetical protein